MKAQRRHELQHNVLADWLGKQLEVVKPYTTWILGGVIAVFAVLIVMQIIATRQASNQQSGWQGFYKALAAADPEERAKELAKVETGPAGLWAHLSLGDLKLDEATAKYYSDKEDSKKALEEAKTHYTRVEEGARGQTVLRQRAALGLAQVYETAGEFDKAKEEYAKVEKESPDSVFGKTAARQIKRLESGDLKSLYEKIAAHKPTYSKPSASGLDGGTNRFPGGGLGGGLGGLGGLNGLGGNVPDFGAPLPERPDLSVPGPALDFPSLDGPENDKKTDDGKTPEEGDDKSEDDAKKPADPEKKADGDKPAEPEKKSDDAEKPAEPEKKPAEPEKKPEGD